MHVTARLVDAQYKTTFPYVKLNAVYDLPKEYEPVFGKQVKVIAGPHSDFVAEHVYTVELLQPELLDQNMYDATCRPFFNSERTRFTHAFASIPIDTSTLVLQQDSN